MRFFQPHRHAPLLARVYARGVFNDGILVRIARPIPGQLHARRDARIGRQDGIDLHQQLFTARILLRQIHYRADQFNVHALPMFR